MKLMKTQDAVGQVLCHDITQIIKGVTKDAVFRKGHVITEEDIPVLLSVGKDNVYIWEKGEKKLHENEAAEILREMCQGEYMHPTPVKEGKIELVADIDGLLKVNSDKIKKVNSMGEMMIASRHGNFAVKKGDKLAGTRIIPLVIEKEKDMAFIGPRPERQFFIDQIMKEDPRYRYLFLPSRAHRWGRQARRRHRRCCTRA